MVNKKDNPRLQQSQMFSLAFWLKKIINPVEASMRGLELPTSLQVIADKATEELGFVVPKSSVKTAASHASIKWSHLVDTAEGTPVSILFSKLSALEDRVVALESLLKELK